MPPALKVFLLALAIIDDLGAILIIAFFYTSDLSVLALALAASGVALLALLNRTNVMRVWPYLLVGAFVWVCVLKSGVHATLAGVATAIAVPLTGAKKGQEGPLERLEIRLDPWVSFFILPVFAFANAGVSLAGVSAAEALSPIPLGIALGLLIEQTTSASTHSHAWRSAAALTRCRQRLAGAAFRHSYSWRIGFHYKYYSSAYSFPELLKVSKFGLSILGGLVICRMRSAIWCWRSRTT